MVWVRRGYAEFVLTDPEDLPPELQWSDDDAPGFRRRRAGSGFTYVGPDGRRAGAATVARIRTLAIPPAWRDVWICADPTGHLQATGRDARGRKQYRYHPAYRAHRDAEKFDRLLDFGESISKLRGRVARDLMATGMPREKVIAAIVNLLELTAVRVGNEEYARDNGSYGLTTLRNRHAKFTPTAMRLVFKGKHGIAADVTVTDARLCRVVRKCQDLPGQVLFQYVDDEDRTHPISSSDVNEYLRSATGGPVTAKDFRTWVGTLLAADRLAAEPVPESETMATKTLAAVFDVVSSHLRNTRAVSRASYVHPAIVDWYRDGSLPERWSAASASGNRRLLPEERKLLGLLRSLRAGRRSSARRPPVRVAS
jgi:DNA topoisomerase I